MSAERQALGPLVYMYIGVVLYINYCPWLFSPVLLLLAYNSVVRGNIQVEKKMYYFQFELKCLYIPLMDPVAV
jgi:hypothetical protein